MKIFGLRRIYSLCLVVLITSCSKSNEDFMFIEPAGSAQYFINNETTKDIVVIYKKSEELGFEIDTTNVIESNTSIKIFTDGVIGVNPVPTNSFSEIKFYNAHDLVNSFLVLSPVKNEDWTIIEQNMDDSEYGLTIYEIKLTD